VTTFDMKQFFALLFVACAVASVQGRALQQAAAAPTTVAEALAATPSLSTLNAAVQVSSQCTIFNFDLALQVWLQLVLAGVCLAAINC
jgi:hypothetical protein